MISDFIFTGGWVIIDHFWIDQRLKQIHSNIDFVAGSQQFTVKNLQFTFCLIVIKQQWNWGFTWKNIYVLSCYIAIDCTAYFDVTNQRTKSITVLDSHFNGVSYAIKNANLGSQQPNIVLDNLLVENSVFISGGAILLTEFSGSLYFNSWTNEYQETRDTSGGKRIGFMDPAPTKSRTLLNSSGAYFSQSKPQYPSQRPIVATDNGVTNDGTGDQTAAINKLLSSNVGSLIFFSRRHISSARHCQNSCWQCHHGIGMVTDHGNRQSL